jgi:hypothetical protein
MASGHAARRSKRPRWLGSLQELVRRRAVHAPFDGLEAEGRWYRHPVSA